MLDIQDLIRPRPRFSRRCPQTVEFSIGGDASFPGRRDHSIDMKLRHYAVVKGARRSIDTLCGSSSVSSSCRACKSPAITATTHLQIFGNKRRSRERVPPASKIRDLITRGNTAWRTATFIHRSRRTSHSASTMSRASNVSCRPRGLRSDKTSRFRSSYCAGSSLAKTSELRKVVRIFLRHALDSQNGKIGSALKRDPGSLPPKNGERKRNFNGPPTKQNSIIGCNDDSGSFAKRSQKVFNSLGVNKNGLVAGRGNSIARPKKSNRGHS